MKIYYQLTKPGIIYGNAVTTVAGFFLAAQGHINWLSLMATLLGISFVIASACVFNNLMDRDIDGKMDRTKNRALTRGAVSPHSAVIFGAVLLLVGCAVLGFWTNLLALTTALGGFIFYVPIYTFLKRRSPHGTLVGAISGAVPPVVGYTAVTNQFDLRALLLFLILVFWQMPHFYAIAIRRLDDYRTAGIPVLPAKSGIWLTKVNMLGYLLGFIIATTLLFTFKFAGLIYFVVALVFGCVWVGLCLQGFRKNINDKLWARQMFQFSLIVITMLSVAIVIDSLIRNKV
jgi:protoheme IX farnesyltransferase